MDENNEKKTTILSLETTKGKILIESINLFSRDGYSEVSMRDIADAVGINAASIYNHFDSKKAILDAIFKFYDDKWNEERPNIDELLRMAETEPPNEVLMKMLFGWDPEINETMVRIYLIAFRESMVHPENIEWIKNLVMERVKYIPRLLLERMMELGRIEPVDIDAFVTILSHLSHSVTILELSPLKIDVEQWLRCWKMLMSVVKPTGK